MWERREFDGVARKPSQFTEQNISTPIVFELFSNSSCSTLSIGFIRPLCPPPMAFPVLVFVVNGCEWLFNAWGSRTCKRRGPLGIMSHEDTHRINIC